MPRIKVNLISARDDDTGDIGLVIQGLQPTSGKVNSAREGLLIAHDLIEHVNGIEQIGSIDDELEALGAIWYVRGQHHELNRDGSGSHSTTYEHIASDVTRMFREHICGSAVSYDLHTRACEADESLEHILRAADSTYLGDVNDDEITEAKGKWAAYRAACLHRMRTGYRKAKGKWAKHGTFAGNNAFWEIAEAVQPYARNCEFEGQQFTLTYNSNAASGDRATCVEVYED